ncbi:TadE/TadG family type IV pilus assembly protein [Brucella intermedia]|uniref:TadE/TadG family type IV pilus assembly protein n=1 Tax=Brucella intermedia TaxID=94625 RepID=UPI00399D65C5
MSFNKCQNGTVAVEFAFLFPLIFLVFMGMLHLLALIDTKRRVDVTASTASDLASVVLSAGNTDIDATTLCAITEVAALNFGQDPRVRPRISMQYFQARQGGLRRSWAVNDQSQLLASPPTTIAAASTTALNVHVDYDFNAILPFLPPNFGKLFGIHQDFWVPLRETGDMTCTTCSNNIKC